MCLWWVFFLKQIGTWIGEVSKANALPNVGGIAQSVEGLNRTKKAEEGQNHCLLELRHPSSPALRHGCFWFSGLWTQIRTNTMSTIPRPWDLDWITLRVFTVLQLADRRLWEFSACITTWINSHNKSPLTYTYMNPIGSVSLENPD